MRTMRRASLTAAILLVAAGAAHPAVAAAVALTDCRLAHRDRLPTVAARCGTLEVPEDPSRPTGRRITLAIAVVPAISREPRPDPLFLLAGGPGQGARETFVAVAGAFTAVRRERDIVLVDQRGTGASNRLDCDFPDDDLDRPEPPPGEYRRLSQECLRRLSADPRFYTTSVAVRDLDAVRAALGYRRIDLYGVSYGTRVAQHYARRYPQRLRAMVLDGVVPPTLVLGPEMAQDAERALRLTLARCAGEPACRTAFGDPRATWRALRARLEHGTVPVAFVDPVTGQPRRLDFGHAHLVLATRMLSYSARSAALLPLLIDRAVRDDFAPLAAQTAMIAPSLRGELAYGMHNAVVCTEDLPFVDARTLDRTRLARTYFGTAALDGLLELCRDWPRGALDADLKSPLRSRVPTLLLSGEADPVTPPAYGTLAARGFEDARHVVLSGQGHGQFATG
jgi:pimeloyl-ACP methyl ester carboxylesterase